MKTPGKTSERKSAQVPRRHFLKAAGAVAVVLGTGSCSVFDGVVARPVELSESGIPVSVGYLLVDTKKCQGCMSCMLACSLVNEGEANLSKSRIQVIQNSFGLFPNDLNVSQCRQCVEPECLKNCPMGAIQADAENGNVRRINLKKCVGCGTCLKSCPYTPSRSFLVPDKTASLGVKARKCDLCSAAPFHWDEKGGGPEGKQACVEACPINAIAFTTEIPAQTEDGYNTNLRDWRWRRLGYPA